MYYISESPDTFHQQHETNFSQSKFDENRTLTEILEMRNTRQQIDSLFRELEENQTELSSLEERLKERKESLEKSVYYNNQLEKNMKIVGSKLISLSRQKIQLEKQYLELQRQLQG